MINMSEIVHANTRASEDYSFRLQKLSEAAEMMGLDRLARSLSDIAVEIEAQAQHVQMLFRKDLFATVDENTKVMFDTLRLICDQPRQTGEVL